MATRDPTVVHVIREEGGGLTARPPTRSSTT